MTFCLQAGAAHTILVDNCLPYGFGSCGKEIPSPPAPVMHTSVQWLHKEGFLSVEPKIPMTTAYLLPHVPMLVPVEPMILYLHDHMILKDNLRLPPHCVLTTV